MIELKPRLWRTLGAAAAFAGGVGLASCGAPTAENAPEAAKSAEAGEAAIGETGGEGASGGEAGEAGASTAYAGLTGSAATSLRLAHLKGFLLIAKKEVGAGRRVEAGALIGQGLAEVQTPAGDAFGDLDTKSIQDASVALMDDKAEGARALDAAIAAIGAKQTAVGAETVRRMLGIAAGLYGEVITADGVDPVEYQHSLGAALAAQDAFNRAEASIKAKNAARAAEAKAELAKVVALWPTPVAPEKPAPAAQVAAQASRVELALSGL